jgi:hypothetical protein
MQRRSRRRGMAHEWYYASGDEKIGPLTREELQEHADSGRLTREDLVWRDGLEEWKPASSLKGLFTRAANPGKSDKVESAKKLLGRAGAFAERVGKVTADAVNPDGFDEYAQFSGGSDQPGIFLHSEYFGGRTRIGASMDSLNTLGAKIGAALFSWFYLLPFLFSLASAWEFLPFKKTEFVRITLEQRIMWRRVTPAMVTWFIIMAVVGIVALIATVFAAGIREFLGDWLGGFFFLFVPLICGGGLIAANLFAYQQILAIDSDSLHRSRIVLHYGFPHKYQLLSGLSDAPIASQIDGVLKLCEGIAKTEFSPWDQFSSHGGGGGMLSAVFSRVRRGV